jgi:hypothetical protein
MAISRVLYAAQTVTLKTSGGTYIIPCQSANADETIPVDDVLVLGKLGAAGRLQKDVASCKASIKGYICTSVLVGNLSDNAFKAADDTLLNTMLSEVRLDSIAGDALTVRLQHNGQNTGGFEFKGACSSVGMDISKGNFGMLDMSFDGVGQINDLSLGNPNNAIPNQATSSTQNNVSEATPTVSSDVILPADGHDDDTIANLKFSFDMPTETLSRLGGTFIGNTNTVEDDNVTFSKPPFKSSMTVDGQSATTMDADATTDSSTNRIRGFDIGGLGVELVSPAVSARSMSQAVGDVGATFSLTIDGTDALFANPQNIQTGPPAGYGDIKDV